MEAKTKTVETIVVGDRVDLQSCPYLKDHPSAEFEYAQVTYVSDEGSAIVIGYDGIDHVGYPKGTNLLVRSGEALEFPAIKAILESQGEGCNESRIGYYASVDALVEAVRSSKNWEEGEVFVFSYSPSKWVVMKQVAPAGCEMLIITNTSVKDVLTAYRFEQDELVALVRKYMDFDPDGYFESTAQAIQQIRQQPVPLDALMAVVKANVEKNELGFASELILEWGSAHDPAKES